MRAKREERESRSHSVTRISHQHLIIILTLFDHFNGINHDMSEFELRAKT